MSTHPERSPSESVVELRLERRRLPQSSLLKVPRQARAIETVHAILDAAVRVLAQGGSAAFNTNRLAEVAGVSPGSLYQYFANREMVLAALVERCVLQAEAVVRGVLRAHQDLPVPAVLRTAIDALAAELERHSGMLAEILILAPLLAQNGMTAVLETRLVEAVREYLAAHPAAPRSGNGAGLFVGVNGCIFVLLKWAAERPPHVSRAALVDAIAGLAAASTEAVADPPGREPVTAALP
jgi:AcrR family transcriptional regulator